MKVGELHPRLTLVATVAWSESCINYLQSVRVILDLERDMVTPTLRLDWRCIDAPPPAVGAPNIAIFTVRLDSEQSAIDVQATGAMSQAFPTLFSGGRIQFAFSTEVKNWRKEFPERSSALAPTTILPSDPVLSLNT